MNKHTLVTLNAELLDDKDTFSYRDIQLLCVKFQLGGKGKREELVEKLQAWHRSRSPLPSPKVQHAAHTRFNDGDDNEEDTNEGQTTPTSPVVSSPAASSPLPMNVPGQRFALLNLNVNVPSPSVEGVQLLSAKKSATRKRRASLLDGLKNSDDATANKVSPRLINPLTRRASLAPEGEAPKSILKSAGPGERRKSLLFSPYNGVRIIPHRLDPEEQPCNFDLDTDP